MKSLRLYYIYHKGSKDLAKIDSSQVQRWLSLLPSVKQKSINSLYSMDQRITSLLALQLLDLCAKHDSFLSLQLNKIQYPIDGKPFLASPPSHPFDFNISHSENLIVVIVSQHLQVGVDVEKIRRLNNNNFKRIFSENELAIAKQSTANFFQLWSSKEAVVKAANTKGWIKMKEVALHNNFALLDNKKWHLTNLTDKLNLPKKFSTIVASSDIFDKLTVKRININQFYYE